MAETATLTSTIAERYATALFDLAEEQGALEAVESDVESLKAAIAESSDLAGMISSPLYGREEQSAAIRAVSEAMGLGAVVANLAGLMAAKRRLFALPDVLDAFTARLAEHRGEVTANVTAARALSDAQIDALKQKLGASLGREVKLDIRIDPAILGGLVVKVGSRMVDTSIRSKLASLQNAMREVG